MPDETRMAVCPLCGGDYADLPGLMRAVRVAGGRPRYVCSSCILRLAPYIADAALAIADAVSDGVEVVKDGMVVVKAHAGRCN